MCVCMNGEILLFFDRWNSSLLFCFVSVNNLNVRRSTNLELQPSVDQSFWFNERCDSSYDQSYDICVFAESGLAALNCELCPTIIVWKLEMSCFFTPVVSRSLAATSRSRSSQWSCEGLRWNGHRRTSPARNTWLRCQLGLGLSCPDGGSMVNVSVILSSRLVKGQSCWSSPRLTAWSTIGTEPSRKPSARTWEHFWSSLGNSNRAPLHS